MGMVLHNVESLIAIGEMANGETRVQNEEEAIRRGIRALSDNGFTLDKTLSEPNATKTYGERMWVFQAPEQPAD